MPESQQVETVIIGAGPAGLAVGACLQRAGREAVILEQRPEVAPSWRGHYDRLHLHTDKRNSALPYQPWPSTAPRYPARLEVVEYLDTYAKTHNLQPRLGQTVRAIRAVDGGWEVQADVTWRARFVVIATGYNRAPLRPEFPGAEQYRGVVLHSGEYKNGKRFEGKQVLVVGFGNSGGELAIDLHEHGALPSLAVRGPVNAIPRELLGIPILTLAVIIDRLPARLADALTRPMARLALGDLSKLGLSRPATGPLEQVRTLHRVPFIDVGTIALIRAGKIKVCPGMRAFTATGVRFADDTEAPFDAVVLATGFRPRLDEFLDAPGALNAEGLPVQNGREVKPGLFFCGFHVAGTGMLREIAIEAKRIAAAITTQSTPALPAGATT